jgi:hypothetical protein
MLRIVNQQLRAAGERGFLVRSVLPALRVRPSAGTSLLWPTRRGVSTQSALRLLGLSQHEIARLTIADLRRAYFVAAKKCHPDTKASADDNDNESDSNIHDEFLQLTTAYEVLHAHVTNNPLDESLAITEDEEIEFRTACQQQLGISAEIVEECKRTPAFRRWLSGRTDAAFHWRNFFLSNGGLAPKLKIIAGALSMPDGQEIQVGRRKRPPRRR